MEKSSLILGALGVWMGSLGCLLERGRGCSRLATRPAVPGTLSFTSAAALSDPFNPSVGGNVYDVGLTAATAIFDGVIATASLKGL